MVMPARYCALNPSTKSRTPFTWVTKSSSRGRSSMLRLYLNPEHPPGSTLTRSPAVSTGTCSWVMNFTTSSAARPVRFTVSPPDGACWSIPLIGRSLTDGWTAGWPVRSGSKLTTPNRLCQRRLERRVSTQVAVDQRESSDCQDRVQHAREGGAGQHGPDREDGGVHRRHPGDPVEPGERTARD